MQLTEFLTACLALGQSVLDSSEKNAALVALATALQRDDPALRSACAELMAPEFSDYMAQELLSDRTCKVLLVVMRAGGVIGLHNHPRQYGFICCLDGRVRVDAYDTLGQEGDMGLLRFCSSVSLGPGEHTDLLPEERNVHRLEATEPAVVIDVFMPPLLEENRTLCRRYEDPPPARPREVVRAKIVPPPTALGQPATGST